MLAARPCALCAPKRTWWLWRVRPGATWTTTSGGETRTQDRFYWRTIILVIAIVVGCVVGYIVQEQIGKGGPVLIGAGLTMGGVFLVLHSPFSATHALSGGWSPQLRSITRARLRSVILSLASASPPRGRSPARPDSRRRRQSARSGSRRSHRPSGQWCGGGRPWGHQRGGFSMQINPTEAGAPCLG